MMNNSQFWTWVDHWQGWDWMREEDEVELELAEWCDETLWMICLLCGSPVEGCMCEEIKDATPTPPPGRGAGAPLPVSLIPGNRDFTSILQLGCVQRSSAKPRLLRSDWRRSSFQLSHQPLSGPRHRSHSR